MSDPDPDPDTEVDELSQARLREALKADWDRGYVEWEIVNVEYIRWRHVHSRWVNWIATTHDWEDITTPPETDSDSESESESESETSTTNRGKRKASTPSSGESPFKKQHVDGDERIDEDDTPKAKMPKQPCKLELPTLNGPLPTEQPTFDPDVVWDRENSGFTDEASDIEETRTRQIASFLLPQDDNFDPRIHEHTNACLPVQYHEAMNWYRNLTYAGHCRKTGFFNISAKDLIRIDADRGHTVSMDSDGSITPYLTAEISFQVLRRYDPRRPTNKAIQEIVRSAKNMIVVSRLNATGSDVKLTPKMYLVPCSLAHFLYLEVSRGMYSFICEYAEQFNAEDEIYADTDTFKAWNFEFKAFETFEITSCARRPHKSKRQSGGEKVPPCDKFCQHRGSSRHAPLCTKSGSFHWHKTFAEWTVSERNTGMDAPRFIRF